MLVLFCYFYGYEVDVVFRCLITFCRHVILH
uniref:Uncharacterized protein n=1 Tax=Rhizophora mucronata TaxID=61149 RepID=A0A2P2QHD9_RHIMU